MEKNIVTKQSTLICGRIPGSSQEQPPKHLDSRTYSDRLLNWNLAAECNLLKNR